MAGTHPTNVAFVPSPTVLADDVADALTLKLSTIEAGLVALQISLCNADEAGRASDGVIADALHRLSDRLALVSARVESLQWRCMAAESAAGAAQ